MGLEPNISTSLSDFVLLDDERLRASMNIMTVIAIRSSPSQGKSGGELQY